MNTTRQIIEQLLGEAGQPPFKSRTTYDIVIERDGVWAGEGKFDLAVSLRGERYGTIRDCAAVLGDDVYDAIEDAIAEMDTPTAGSVVVDDVTYNWELYLDG